MIHQAQKELSIDLSRSVLIDHMVSYIQVNIEAVVGTNLLFDRPSELDGLRYELIATFHETVSYLRRGAE